MIEVQGWVIPNAGAMWPIWSALIAVIHGHVVYREIKKWF